jgi:hypothetical protein
LAEVHAFTAHGEGDVDAVVDEEWDVVGFASLVECFSFGDEDACVGCFVAVLNGCDTWSVSVKALEEFELATLKYLMTESKHTTTRKEQPTSLQSLLDNLYKISRSQNGFCRVSHEIQRVVDLVLHVCDWLVQ